jgi:transposase InsO family protein
VVERAVRVRAIQLGRRLRAAGQRRRAIAAGLGASVRTLAEWERRYEDDRLAIELRGRPVKAVPPSDEAALCALLDFLGPAATLPVLWRSFPELARAEVEQRLRAYREDVLCKNGVEILALRWTWVGAVWAMDFAEPPASVDARFPYILSVRDLASGKALLWLPVREKSATAVSDALRALFVEVGRPLVLKHDNDKAFLAHEVADLLAAHGVVTLRSPCYYPEYNGACEAGIGTLKTYAHHEAARHDRPGEWTCDDVEAARRRANELCRPRGHAGPSPDELWSSCQPPSDDERHIFERTVADERRRHQEQAVGRRGSPVSEKDEQRVERQAITAALVACGILEVRRRRISPPFKSRLWARITP